MYIGNLEELLCLQGKSITENLKKGYKPYLISLLKQNFFRKKDFFLALKYTISP